MIKMTNRICRLCHIIPAIIVHSKSPPSRLIFGKNKMLITKHLNVYCLESTCKCKQHVFLCVGLNR